MNPAPPRAASLMHRLRHTLVQAAARLADAGVPEPRLKAELALARVLGLPRLEIFLRGPAALSPPQGSGFEALIARLLRHEPWQYISGETDFLGHLLRCTPAALIPRPETEQLAQMAADALRAFGSGAQAADIGTGTGCIAIHLALSCPAARVIAVDASPEALELARANALRTGAEVEFRQGDLVAPIRERLHLLVSNPPYIGEEERDLLETQLAHEPDLALFGGPRGHELPERLIRESTAVLRPGGKILLEIGATQGMVMARCLRETGFDEVTLVDDLRGRQRIATAVWNARPTHHP